MRISDFGRYAPSICAAAALLAGCGSQPPIGAPGAMPQSPAIATHAAHGTSWVASGTSSGDLLYAVGGPGAYILSYPAGQLMGTAQVSLPERPCSDTQGNVYITSGLSAPATIYEFVHGGTQPIRTLNDAYGVPRGCAVDPLTGNLAVANEAGTHGASTGNLLVYKNARGTPIVYEAPSSTSYFFCAYDNNGNLFANRSGVWIDKLARRGSKLQMLTITNNTLKNPGAMQWDGQYLAITDSGRSAVYRFKITGLTATAVGKTNLRGWSQVAQRQSAIYQGAFITPTAHAGNKVGIWNYPDGGKHSAIWDFSQSTLEGVTISVAPSR